LNRYTKHILLAFLSVLVIASCNDLDNSGQVFLEVGDNFQLANDTYPQGTVFLVKAGEHSNQKVHNPKVGNRWIGEKGAILDGGNRVDAAFSGTAKNIIIQGVTLRNYVDNGIHFRSGENITINRIRVYDSGTGTGERNGAMRFERVIGLNVLNSHLQRVTSGILPSYSEGPIIISGNSGVNVGRNFIQLDKVTGAGIEIKNNVMERQGDFLRDGADDVVDWISIFRSEGTPDSPIHVFRNRAKGHGFDTTGSFIMLGDDGGRYQLAEENIGVNPGQVGVGIAGGENIMVKENIMFSDESDFSNVAFYSADYSTPNPCYNHAIVGNRSYWTSNNRQNNVWTDQKCAPLIENNIFPDLSINELVWEKAFPE
jgi:hypothetical protein